MVCKFCGSEVADDAKFCTCCGNPVQANANANNSATPQNQAFEMYTEPYRQTYNQQSVGSAYNSQPTEPNVAAQEPKKSRKKLVIAIIAVLVALAVAITGVLVYFKKKDNGTADTAKKAYSAVLKDEKNEFGETKADGVEVVGVCYAELIDFDGDGEEEFLTTHNNGDGYEFAVYSYDKKKGSATQVGTGKPAKNESKTTVEIVKNGDKKYVKNSENKFVTVENSKLITEEEQSESEYENVSETEITAENVNELIENIENTENELENEESKKPESTQISIDSQKDELLNKVQSEFDNIVQFYCEDFDMDGKAEAFIAVSETGDADTYSDNTNLINGSVYFINNNEIIQLQTNLQLVVNSNAQSTSNDNENIVFETVNVNGENFIKVSSNCGNYNIVYVYYVENSSAVELENAPFLSFEKSDYGDFLTISSSEFDGASDGTGHTWKEYYFYFDNGLKEYGGIEISKADFKKFSGAEKVLNDIKKEKGTITNIFVRENGIININYTVSADYISYNSNANMIYKNGKLNYINSYSDEKDENLANSDFGGIYKAAMFDNIATYPDDVDEILNN